MKIYPGYEKWSDIELLTGLLIGECDNQPEEGKIAVALTVKTRVNHPMWWGRNWREVILASKQFSCWEDHNATRIKQAYSLKGDDWKVCLRVAQDVYDGNILDTMGKPTHYHKTKIHPDWASLLIRLKIIGDHIFYHDPVIDWRKK
jgi:spore germination cell wall hydrolase CwlJ-like protein